MNVRMDTNDTVACRELPARNNETVKPVIVCLLNSEVKRDLMMGRKYLERFKNLRQRTAHQEECRAFQEGERTLMEWCD